MALDHPIISANARIVRAAINSPPMTRGERDTEAVRIMQRALVSVGAATLNRSIRGGEPDGNYGTETVAAVRRFQASKGLVDAHGNANGVAGQPFWEVMDDVAPPDLAPPSLPPGAATPETPGTTRAPNRPRLPTATAMMREYRRFRELDRPGRPCGRPITNQCGVRMSVALMRCDIGFHYSGPHLGGLIHNSPSTCGINISHTHYLFQLMDQMAEFWPCETYNLDPQRRRHFPLPDLIQRIENSPGFILFRRMSSLGNPPAPGTENHRHIDYWNGSWVMNDLLNYNAANERSPEARMDHHRFLRRSGIVQFIPLDRP